jgi:hypothetical protein
MLRTHQPRALVGVVELNQGGVGPLGPRVVEA